MVELSRRFFLGGAIALIGATTFKPAIAAISNMPTITGDGVTDDSYGFGCLFRNEPVIFKHDQLGVDSHQGIIFYNGRFAIERTVNIPADAKIEMGHALFVGTKLEHDAPFFMAERGFDAKQFEKGCAIFELKNGAPNRLIMYDGEKFNAELNEKHKNQIIVTVGKYAI